MPDSTEEFDAPDDQETQPTDNVEVHNVEIDGEPAEPEPLPDDSADEDKPSSKREAKYRVQLRETEAERDQLRGTVEAMQRTEVERIAGASIQKPSAIWSSDVELGSLLDDTGKVDPLKVAAAAKRATEDLGLATKRPGGYVPREGTSTHQSTGGSNTWESAFKG